MNEKRNSIRRNLFFVVVLLLIVLVVVSTQNDVQSIMAEIRHMNAYYLIFAVLMMVIYWFFWAMSLHVVARVHEPELRPLTSLAIANTDLFFNGITPFSTGGQPYQVYAYAKVGVKPAKATGILTMNFIIYQLTINLISIIAILIYFSELRQAINSFAALVFVGFVINISIFSLLILMAISKHFAHFCDGILKLLSRIKPLRKTMEKIRSRVFEFVADFQTGFKVLFTRKKVLFLALGYKTIAMIAFFTVPYAIFIAFGLPMSLAMLLYVIAMSSFATTFMVWMPTPGAAGGAEFAFTVLFVTITGVTATLAVAASLIWRFFTYYCSMLVGFIAFLVFEGGVKS